MTELDPTEEVRKRQNLPRSDVIGLRGVAILFVVLSHYKFSGFSAGFIGVDIFFVISGFLITGSILDELPRKFSFFRFYLRRARRILPVAFFVAAIVLFFSWLNFGPGRFGQILADADMSLGFAGNVKFLAKSLDYYAAVATPTPFLHYWSLSVEEQFYLVWPLFFVFLYWLQKRRNSSVIFYLGLLAVTCGSLYWANIQFENNPQLVYFSPVSRVWELSLGAIFSVLARNRRPIGSQNLSVLFRLLALSGIATSLVLVNEGNYTFTLLLPTVSVGYLLYTGFDPSIRDGIQLLLSTPPLTFFGKISYSLYLWHWPIYVFGAEFGLLQSSLATFVALCATVILSFLTYKLVEQPFMGIPIGGSK
jgi:peptidoglycan/LPS O-acetylase OafA/YrhL